jgi:hypothetical protein
MLGFEYRMAVRLAHFDLTNCKRRVVSYLMWSAQPVALATLLLETSPGLRREDALLLVSD